MTDMFEVVAVFGVIKPLILDLPPILGAVKQHPTADLCDWESVSQNASMISPSGFCCR